MDSRLSVIGALVLATTPVAILIWAAVRFAGSTSVLNFLESDRVRDMAAVNRWVGNRLLLLPIGMAVAGWMGLHSPLAAMLSLPALALLLIGVLAWVMAGVRKFY
jgi:hypothetical protein